MTGAGGGGHTGAPASVRFDMAFEDLAGKCVGERHDMRNDGAPRVLRGALPLATALDPAIYLQLTAKAAYQSASSHLLAWCAPRPMHNTAQHAHIRLHVP